MKHYSLPAQFVFSFLLSALIALDAPTYAQQNSSDTSLSKQFSPNSDSNFNRDEIGKHFDKLDLEMKHLDVQMQKLDEQMKKLDMEKIQHDIDEAMKKVDFEKINQQVNEAMKNVNRDKLSKEMAAGMARASKVQMEQVKKQLAITRAQLERQKINLNFNKEKIKANAEKAIKSAKKSIAEAKGQLKQIQEFTDALEKDGLIDKSKPYKVEVKSGELYINGKKQTKEVSDKYRKYYKKENFTIDMNEGDGVRI